jgi:hypothetical protein
MDPKNLLAGPGLSAGPAATYKLREKKKKRYTKKKKKY